jgi:biotin carboxyl carrier protein
MKYLVTVGTETLELDVTRRPDGSYGVLDDTGLERDVRVLAGPPQTGLLSVLVDGQTVEVQPTDAEARFQQDRFSVRAESLRDRGATRAAASDVAQARQLLASMPGRIVRVLCEPGAAVAQGRALIVIEAMKMQNELCAQADAVVRAVHVSPGQTVDRGALLLEFE